jgi:hypothetical protein
VVAVFRSSFQGGSWPHLTNEESEQASTRTFGRQFRA